MAKKVLVIGESGSGKSTSIKNLDPSTTFVINCADKDLPFEGSLSKYKKATQEDPKGNMISPKKEKLVFDDNMNIVRDIKKPNVWASVIKAMQFVDEKCPGIKTLVIDDIQYVLIKEYMDRASEKGFDKFSELAQHYYFIMTLPETMREDLTVVFLSHSQVENGVTKIKTIGKMLDGTVTLEGLFTIAIECKSIKSSDGSIKHGFVVHNLGDSLVKAPDGMFDKPVIPNDLSIVLEKINDYYNKQ